MNRTWPESVVCDEVLPLGGADRADPRRVPERCRQSPQLARTASAPLSRCFGAAGRGRCGLLVRRCLGGASALPLRPVLSPSLAVCRPRPYPPSQTPWMPAPPARPMEVVADEFVVKRRYCYGYRTLRLQNAPSRAELSLRQPRRWVPNVALCVPWTWGCREPLSGLHLCSQRVAQRDRNAAA